MNILTCRTGYTFYYIYIVFFFIFFIFFYLTWPQLLQEKGYNFVIDGTSKNF